MTATRGTSNSNDRGSSYARAARRSFLLSVYAADVPGYTRCYRCGALLGDGPLAVGRVTVDRIVPGCHGGTYRRDNIRPACDGCNSTTGGRTRSKKR